MGMTLFSLHVYGGTRAAMEAQALPGDVVRVNGPWVSLLPGENAMGHGYARLATLAKKADAPAVLFSYLDDDQFTAGLYVKGKRVALADSGGKSSKVTAFGQVIPGRDAKALKLLPHCATPEEQLALLEETLGVALYDAWDMAPRPVAHGTATQKRVQQRWNELRRRPDQFRLAAVARADWPDEAAAMEAFDRALGTDRAFQGPAQGWGTWYTSHYHRFGLEEGVVLYHASTGETMQVKAREPLAAVAGVTEDGLPVCTFWDQPQVGPRRVSCLNPDGSERWRFAPALAGVQCLDVSRAAPGQIMVYTRFLPEWDKDIWALDARDGRVAHHQTMAAKDGLASILWVDSLGQYAAYALGSNEMVMLDTALREVNRWPLGSRQERFDLRTRLQGNQLWHQRGVDGTVTRLNLATGELTRLTLEMPASFAGVTAEGNLLCFGPRADQLLCFGPSGKLAARLRVPSLHQIIHDASDTYTLHLAPNSGKYTVQKLLPK